MNGIRIARILNIATDMATYNTCIKYRMAALTTDRKGKVIMFGNAWNSFTKTHPMQKKYAKEVGNGNRMYLHAEISALVRSRKKPYYVFVARVSKEGKQMLAKPCSVCIRAMEEAGVKQVYYTTSNGTGGLII